MTNARVAASNAAAGRAQTIGNTRLGQQQQGLNYYQGLQGQGTGYLSGLQQQQTGQQESALNRQQQAYGQATGAANSAGQLAESASQNPTMFDKVMGGISGGVGALGGLSKATAGPLASVAKFLEDGDVMPEARQSAVIAENGPEKVVSTSPQGANGIFTQPTQVNLLPGEAVVPLSYRATAKVRPSAAGLPAAPVTYPYRSQRGVNAPASVRP